MESPLNDHANGWKLYDVAAAWVRHAEAKSAGILAANAVLAASLYTVIPAGGVDNVPVIGVGVAAALLVLGSLACALWSMRPSLKVSGQPQSLLFFDHVAQNYAEDPEGYAAARQELLADRQQLESDLAGQTWSLAKVARAKYQWNDRAVWALLPAFGLTLAFVLTSQL